MESNRRFCSARWTSRRRCEVRTWLGLALDELTFTAEEAWTRLKRACGTASEATLRFRRLDTEWTRLGVPAIYQIDVQGYECIRAKPLENKHILAVNPDFYERLEHSYDSRFYRQEVLGEYLNIAQGRVYEAFDYHEMSEPVEYDSSATLYWSLDFNVTPLCSVLAQKRRQADFRLSMRYRSKTRRLAMPWKLSEQGGPGAARRGITGDASGRQRSVNTQGDTYTELQHQLDRAGFTELHVASSLEQSIGNGPSETRQRLPAEFGRRMPDVRGSALQRIH